MTCFKLALAAVLVAAVATAAPACVQGTLASYILLGATGCSVGNETFNNFTAPTYSNSLGVPQLTTAEFQITPSQLGSADFLTFVYLNSNATPTPVTVNQNGQIFGFNFSFQATMGNAILLSAIQMNSTFSNTIPGSVSATKNAQAGANPTATSTVSDGGSNHALATYNGTISPVTGTGTFNVQDTISLQAQTGGAATSSGFANGFFEVNPSAVPEPMVLVTVGSGLFLIGLLKPVKKRS